MNDISTDEGARCRSCGTTALACQREYQASIDPDSDLRAWCCSACRAYGARAAHVVSDHTATEGYCPACGADRSEVAECRPVHVTVVVDGEEVGR